METEIPNKNTFVLNDSVRDSNYSFEALSRRWSNSSNPDRIFQAKKRVSQVKSLTKKNCIYKLSRQSLPRLHKLSQQVIGDLKC